MGWGGVKRGAESEASIGEGASEIGRYEDKCVREGRPQARGVSSGTRGRHRRGKSSRPHMPDATTGLHCHLV